MENQRRIAERALYAAARNTHSAATTMRKDYEASTKKDPQAKAGLPRAVRARRSSSTAQFIATYPDSRLRLRVQLPRGRGAVLRASAIPRRSSQYKWVRDHRDLGTDVLPRRRALGRAVATRPRPSARSPRASSQPLKIPTVAELKAMPQPWQPQPIPRRSTSSSRPSTTTTRTSSTIRRRRRSRASTPR